jgi:radical SAM superfamily enzyme YgiQ (UPF0313 family)
MKILFVRPRPSPETIGLQHVMIVEPLELEVLAALVPPEDTPVIFDMILEKRSFISVLLKELPDVLCVTGYITHVGIMKEYCRTAKRVNPRMRTIVGGVHCEVCPGDFDDDAIDFRVVRNATTVFPRLLSHLSEKEDLPRGVLRKGEQMQEAALPKFDFAFPLPRRSLTSSYRDKYFYIFHDRVALIKTSFGCPYDCNFCFCRAITNNRYFERPLTAVMDELETVREREIYIVDDDFLVSRSRLEHFAEENIGRKLAKEYLIYGRADFIARNPDTLGLLKSIGLRTVIVGFESFFDDELSGYGKGVDARLNREAMKVLTAFGIDCYATIIVPPHWKKLEFAECGRSLRSLGIYYVNLQPLTPLPGTGFGVADNDLVIGRNDYPRWDLAHVTIRPEHASVPEYYRSILQLYNDVLFQPHHLWNYVRRYRARQLWKMASGTMRVRKQYLRRISEASSHA